MTYFDLVILDSSNGNVIQTLQLESGSYLNNYYSYANQIALDDSDNVYLYFKNSIN